MRIGIIEGRLGQPPEARFARAREIGFDAVELSFHAQAYETLPLWTEEGAARVRRLAAEAGVAVPSVCATYFNQYAFASPDAAERERCVEVLRRLIDTSAAAGLRTILLPFFGNGALKTQEEMDYVGDVLREHAPAAEKAGIILGLEDTISAKDNVRIMERTKSPAVLTYYDVGNSTRNGFDVLSEIKWLGRERICEVHLKDNPHYLGEGTIHFAPILHTILDIGFSGYANLETDTHPGMLEADMRRNLLYVRRLLA
jgi:sugar phosphate isomerase/epimerase